VRRPLFKRRRSPSGLLGLRAASLVSALLAFLLAASALAAGKPVDEATAADKKNAAAAYTRAMSDFDKERLEPALQGFRDSYNIVQSPNSHFMIARTLVRLGRNDEAYDELNAVIKEADGLGEKYADTVHAAYSKLDEIKPRIGFVVVTLVNAPKGTTVKLGDQPLDPDRIGKPVAVLPGETVVYAFPPERKKYTEKVTIAGGATESVSFDLAVPPKDAPPPEKIYHAAYRVELEGEAVGESLAPPDPVTRGAGAGVRASFVVVPTAVLGTRDNLALSTGFEWIGTSTDPHFWVPFELQWNVWLSEAFSLRFEPGAAVMFGAGTRVAPSLYAGLEWHFAKRWSLVGRAGIPVCTVGLSLML
jgi:hypothetical protein